MISSVSNAQIKEIQKLQKSVRERRKKNLFVVEGEKLAEEAAVHGQLEKLYLSETALQRESGRLQRLVAKQEYEVVSDAVFSALSETVTPQGVLGLVRIPFYPLDFVLSKAERGVLLLDNLRDPGNLGTIVRTAEGAGMAGVVLSRESVDLFNPKTVRATMGAVFRVPFFYAEDFIAVIEDLKEAGVPVYGTMMQGSVLYHQADFTKGAGIVIGNEANGISESVAKALSGTVRIPMEGELESLNAAVSAAILMYEAARQRRCGK